MAGQEKVSSPPADDNNVTQPLLEPIGKLLLLLLLLAVAASCCCWCCLRILRRHCHDLAAQNAGTSLVVRVEDGPLPPPSPLAQLSPSWAQLGNTHWLLTTAIMLSDMFGLGTLSLPGGTLFALALLQWQLRSGSWSILHKAHALLYNGARNSS